MYSVISLRNHLEFKFDLNVNLNVKFEFEFEFEFESLNLRTCRPCLSSSPWVRQWYSDGAVMVQGKTDQHARQMHVLISHEVIIGAEIISVSPSPVHCLLMLTQCAVQYV